MYDIDLMWHTHQVLHEAYVQDTKTYLGYVLNHDDMDQDRSPGSHLVTSDSQTRQLWSDTFGASLAIPGAKYRGEQPRLRMVPEDNDVVYNSSTYACTVIVKSVHLSGPPPGIDKWSLEFSLLDRDKGNQGKPFMKLKPKGVLTRWEEQWSSSGLGRFSFDNSVLGYILLSIKSKAGILEDSTIVASNAMPFLNDARVKPGPPVQLVDEGRVRYLGSDLTVKITSEVTVLKRGSAIFQTIPQDFRQQQMAVSMWGPVPLVGHSDGHTAMVANHKFVYFLTYTVTKVEL